MFKKRNYHKHIEDIKFLLSEIEKNKYPKIDDSANRCILNNLKIAKKNLSGYGILIRLGSEKTRKRK